MITHNSIKAYLSLCLTKPFLGGKLKYDGEEDEDFKNIVENTKMWGGELGLGGEFGLRYLHIKYNETQERTSYNYNTNTYQTTQIDYDYRINISPTFSRISLNYYF